MSRNSYYRLRDPARYEVRQGMPREKFCEMVRNLERDAGVEPYEGDVFFCPADYLAFLEQQLRANEPFYQEG